MEYINNIKTPFLAKVGWYLSLVGYLYRNNGLKGIYDYIKMKIQISTFQFKFRHIKRCRKQILSCANADNIFWIALLDNGFRNFPANVDKYTQYLSEEERQKYEERSRKFNEEVEKRCNELCHNTESTVNI